VSADEPAKAFVGEAAGVLAVWLAVLRAPAEAVAAFPGAKRRRVATELRQDRWRAAA
jgi:hypothetical protein